MATRRRADPPEPPWQVILEDIRSQNRATLEAVEASRVELNARFDREHEAVDARFTVVEGAIRGLASDVRELKTDVKVLKTDVTGLKTVADLKTDVADLKTDVAGLKTDVAGLKTDVAGLKTDLRRVEGKVDGLVTLEARVTALERSR
jgi:outer membrane murein-binding lipoprotein Lpp